MNLCMCGHRRTQHSIGMPAGCQVIAGSDTGRCQCRAFEEQPQPSGDSLDRATKLIEDTTRNALVTEVAKLMEASEASMSEPASEFSSGLVCEQHLRFIPCRKEHKGDIPVTVDAFVIEIARRYQAGKLSFTLLEDGDLDVENLRRQVRTMDAYAGRDVRRIVDLQLKLDTAQAEAERTESTLQQTVNELRVKIQRFDEMHESQVRTIQEQRARIADLEQAQVLRVERIRTLTADLNRVREEMAQDFRRLVENVELDELLEEIKRRASGS